MEKENMYVYESPAVEVIEVEVEKGFQLSESFSSENGNPVQGN